MFYYIILFYSHAINILLVQVFVLVIVVIKHFEIGLVDIDLYIDFAVFGVFGQYFVNNFL